ncbi:hypothetical protein [Bradyrhizobium sp. Arg816]|uniref:hypothetical protein n=1 Tax=Bradyrhizobium sp. Arg816 TaxID=2998491 RepID=UPI00249F5A58|nr:hypothetical protein [Bradyrhizobium sp. Arg816]MDI3561299.1 hypothetical protein [Bradyrhizobium sp. Arg816]
MKDYLLRPDRERQPMPRMHWRWIRRRKDLAAIFEERCAGCFPDDDAGRDYAVQLVNHMIRLVPNGVAAARANARLHAPWLTVEELDDLIASALESLEHPPISAAKLGKTLRLTADEVERRGITTITAHDHGAEETRKRQREWAEKDRRAKGAKSREEYEAQSKSRTEPWLALNMSRPTYYRKLKASEIPNETSPSTHYRAMEGCNVDAPVSRLPCAMIRASAIDLTGIDLARFGIVAISVMSNSRVIRHWHAGRPMSAAPQASARARQSLEGPTV